jgi:lysophospholipase L1-like esterase
MFTHHFKGISARAGAVTLLSLGMVAGIAGAPANAQTQTTQTTIAYTVMGDSYSAGSGAGNNTEAPPCFQSSNGYGNDVAAMTGATLTNIACAGFTTTQVTTYEVPQLPATTKLITLTAGGNDVAWTTAVGTCLLPTSTAAACKAAVANSVYLMTQVPKNATAMLKAIKAKAPRAKILYLGYPRLFEPQNMSAPTFTATQVAGAKLLNGAADLLNGVLALTALSNGVTFVPVAYRFAGHGMPSADPWLNYPAPFGTNNFPFHPNAAGYLDGYAAAVRPFL